MWVISERIARHTQPGKAGQLLNGACNLVAEKNVDVGVSFQPQLDASRSDYAPLFMRGGKSRVPVHFRPHSLQ